MSRVTYYVSLPFHRSPDGDLIAGEAKDAPNAAIAQSRAAGMLGKEVTVPSLRKKQPPTIVTYIGAVAFSRTGDPDFGDFDDAVVLARYGETPENLDGME
jgi:hypothetical protein